MCNTYQFIAATPSHYEAILSLFSTPEELFLSCPSATWPLDRVQLKKIAEERSDLTVLLDRQLVIGFANLYQSLAGDKFFIGNVILSHNYRGKGLGKALVCHMCDRIYDRYAKTAHITVFNHNTPALALYASLGFKPYDLELRRMPNNETTVAIQMQRHRKSVLERQSRCDPYVPG
jgi:ribosomal protein S18 acetylase RimI-like enzyme